MLLSNPAVEAWVEVCWMKTLTHEEWEKVELDAFSSFIVRGTLCFVS